MSVVLESEDFGTHPFLTLTSDPEGRVLLANEALAAMLLGGQQEQTAELIAEALTRGDSVIQHPSVLKTQ